MPRSMCAAVNAGSFSVILSSKAMPGSYRSHFSGFRVLRPPRREQCAAQFSLCLGQVSRPSPRTPVDSVIPQPAHGRNRGIHALFPILEAGLEGLAQLHDDEIPIELLCENEGR